MKKQFIENVQSNEKGKKRSDNNKAYIFHLDVYFSIKFNEFDLSNSMNLILSNQ